MISYIIVAVIAIFVGAALTYFYQKKVQSELIKDHNAAIFMTEQSWFKAGFDAGYEDAVRNTRYDAIKKGLTK